MRRPLTSPETAPRMPGTRGGGSIPVLVTLRNGNMVICRGDPITIRQLEGNDTLTAQTLFHPFPPRAKPAKLSSLTFSNSLLSFISLLSSVHYYYSLSLIFFHTIDAIF